MCRSVGRWDYELYIIVLLLNLRFFDSKLSPQFGWSCIIVICGDSILRLCFVLFSVADRSNPSVAPRNTAGINMNVLYQE